MISYAQNFEDVMLARAFAGITDGFYVDAGAWDPMVDSVTKHFYDLGWSGVNIEPHPVYYDRLVAERPRDKNIQCALGDGNEFRTLYLYEGGGMSTLRHEWSTLFADKMPMTEVTVEIRPMADLLDRVPKDTHFFKVDTEGWELFVLRGCDWDKFRPRIVLVESVHPLTRKGIEQEWEPFLLTQGYDFVYFDGLNRFYIAREHSRLRDHFATPPNIFDGFTLLREIGLQKQIDELRAMANQAQSDLDDMGRHLSEPLSIEWQPQNEGLLPAVQEVRRFITEVANRIGFMQREFQELERDAKAARL